MAMNRQDYIDQGKADFAKGLVQPAPDFVADTWQKKAWLSGFESAQRMAQPRPAGNSPIQGFAVDMERRAKEMALVGDPDPREALNDDQELAAQCFGVKMLEEAGAKTVTMDDFDNPTKGTTTGRISLSEPVKYMALEMSEKSVKARLQSVIDTDYSKLEKRVLGTMGDNALSNLTADLKGRSCKAQEAFTLPTGTKAHIGKLWNDAAQEQDPIRKMRLLDKCVRLTDKWKRRAELCN